MSITLIIIGLIADVITSAPIPLDSLSEIPKNEWPKILQTSNLNQAIESS